MPSPIQTVSALRAEGLADLDAFEIVLDGLPARAGVGVRERAELVASWPAPCASEKVLEFIASKPSPKRARRLLQPVRVGLVPRDMQRHGRRRARQLVDDRAVVELVEDVARLAGAGEAREARAAGADAPGRHGHVERRDLVADRVDRDAAPRELLAEVRVVGCRARALCGAGRCRSAIDARASAR